jgi:plastocyanin
MLLATGGIHLDLYVTGYRSIPTIGVLFILQVAGALTLGLAVTAVPRRVVAVSGALFALSTLGGYVLSIWVGLFGFKEVRTTAGIFAGILEVGTFALLGTLAIRPAPRDSLDAKRSPTIDQLFKVGSYLLAPVGIVAALVFAIALIAAPSVPNGAAGPGEKAPSGAVVHVTIHNFSFSPNPTLARPGEMVEVTNHDGVAHTFSAMSGDKSMFTTGPIVPNQTRTVVAPMIPGSYPYHCQIHSFMTGVLVVT